MMRNGTLRVTIGLALLAMACTDAGTAPDSSPLFAGRGGHGGSGGGSGDDAAIALSAVFANLTGIYGDSAGAFDGAYVDGQEFVGVVLQATSGNLGFDAGKTKKKETPNRAVCVDFSDPIDFANPPFTSGCVLEARITTGQLTDTIMGDPIPDNLRGMAIGQAGTTRLLLWWPGATEYFLRFGTNCDAGDDADTRASATHRDADTWVLSGTSARLCSHVTKGNKPMVDEGMFLMPFEMTLTQQ